MSYLIFNLIAFLIALFAFIFGAVKLFKPKKPLYFKLLICSVGCYALAQLSGLVYLWCDMINGVWTWMLGIFGCGMFLVSANYGAYDSLVDDGTFLKARREALAAPLVFIIMIIVIALLWRKTSIFKAIMLVVMLGPSVPASYFSLKHLLLPMDDFGLLKGTRSCDILQLAFFSAALINAVLLYFSAGIAEGIIELFISIVLCLLTFAAIKGETIWRT